MRRDSTHFFMACGNAKRLLIALLFSIGMTSAQAEFISLEPVAKAIADQAAPRLKDQTVVVAARSLSRNVGPWPVHEALSVELTSTLCSQGIDAIRSATHPATETLGKSSGPFSKQEAQSAKLADRDLLVAIIVIVRPPAARVQLLPSDGGNSLEEFSVPLSPECFDMNANIPDLNRKVRAFCRGQIGSKVGDGICATLAGDALKSADAVRSGVYTWGRELDAYEPVLPGDIIQLEQVKLKGPKFTRNYEHHTAIVEEVRGDGVIVLQQNVPPEGKVVQRETWAASLDRSGIIQVFRPWDGESPLPPVSPRRREDPTIVRRGNTIDLLQTLDPRLDSVRGIWYRVDGGIRWNRDTYARLQVPVTPPESYTLRLKIRRLVGSDQFGVGLIVGGHQALLSIDGYGGNKTGLHLLDGKKSKDSEGAYSGPVLPMDQTVELVVQVRPDSVRLTADGKPILNWSGDPSRLSMDKLYSVPRSDWLFLASWNTHFELTEYTLEEN